MGSSSPSRAVTRSVSGGSTTPSSRWASGNDRAVAMRFWRATGSSNQTVRSRVSVSRIRAHASRSSLLRHSADRQRTIASAAEAASGSRPCRSSARAESRERERRARVQPGEQVVGFPVRCSAG